MGKALLALKRSGKDIWSVCSIDVRTGKVRWCSPLPRRTDTALSVVGDRAIVHDHDGYLFAYDLGAGRAMWNVKLDCAISEGGMRAVGMGLAVAACTHGESGTIDSRKVDLLAIDLETGQLRWRNSPASEFSRFYLDGDQIVVKTPAPMPHFDRPELAKLIANSLGPSRPLAKRPRTLPKTDSAERIPAWRTREMALVGRENIEWSVIDTRTGKVLPHAVLNGGVRILIDAGVPTSMAVEPLFSRDVAFFSQTEAGARTKSPLYHFDCSRQFSPGCFGTPLHNLNQVLRGGRLFEVACKEVVEIDAAQTPGRRWPISGGADFFEPSVMALDAVGPRLTLVLASNDDLEVGRVVTYDGWNPPLVAKAPGLDPDLVALMEGVLVVQVGAHPRADGAMAYQAPALVGYDVVEADEDAVPEGPTDKDRLREIIRGRGGFEPVQCELWKTSFDAQIVPRMKALPLWEEHLISLFRDRDLFAQGAALAAAAHLRTPALLRALLQMIEPLPPEDWRTGDRGRGWWGEVRERHQATRSHAAMALIEMKYPPALKALAAMALETPLPDYDHVPDCSAVGSAFCSWMEGSDLPEAKAATADYDHAVGIPGALETWCASRHLLRAPRKLFLQIPHP